MVQERRAPTTEEVRTMIAATKLNELSSPDGSVEFSKQQVLQFVIENRTADPSAPVDGQIWLRTDL